MKKRKISSKKLSNIKKHLLSNPIVDGYIIIEPTILVQRMKENKVRTNTKELYKAISLLRKHFIIKNLNKQYSKTELAIRFGKTNFIALKLK